MLFFFFFFGKGYLPILALVVRLHSFFIVKRAKKKVITYQVYVCWDRYPEYKLR